ncbi:MAG: bifunctional DNA-formamidopyrimidine glycosylase/DNA-(apurinic or apyrimidinic site) lyase [Desulfocurvibacter africanus]
MPELPEVETIARGLAPDVQGRVIAEVEVRYSGAVCQSAGPGTTRKTTAPEKGRAFADLVRGRRVDKVWRRAKLLVFDLGPNSAAAEFGADKVSPADLHLVFHLKMTGSVWLPPSGAQPDAHTHIVFTLDNGTKIHFRDIRKFGWCLALTSEELRSMPFFAALGPEPLEIGEKDFVALFKGRKAGMKALLLDQEVIAGIGNIYADESLFRSGIHPRTKAADVPEAKLRSLHKELQAVLRQAIAENGSTFSDYRTAQGDAGAFQNRFLVYGRAGEKCVKCGGGLRSEVVAGRTSVFCAKCQV